MTLAADQTINSLSITNGYTLSGATHSITTIGNVSVASGAVLSIDDMNVGGAFTDSGSATFAGHLTINSGGQFTLSSGTLSGGINGAGTFETASGTTGTLRTSPFTKARLIRRATARPPTLRAQSPTKERSRWTAATETTGIFT